MAKPTSNRVLFNTIELYSVKKTPEKKAILKASRSREKRPEKNAAKPLKKAKEARKKTRPKVQSSTNFRGFKESTGNINIQMA